MAMSDLNEAQATLDDKENELAGVRAMYDAAMLEKQVKGSLGNIVMDCDD